MCKTAKEAYTNVPKVISVDQERCNFSQGRV